MANEKRLIDANALQLEPDPWGGMNGVICLGRSGGKTMATVQAALKCMIDNAPTVDAVEVVRCKDCKYYEHPEYYGGGTKDVCRTFKRQTREDDFCSYGERKDNG